MLIYTIITLAISIPLFGWAFGSIAETSISFMTITKKM